MLEDAELESAKVFSRLRYLFLAENISLYFTATQVKSLGGGA